MNRRSESGLATLVCILVVIFIVVGYVIIRVVWKCCKLLDHPHPTQTNDDALASTRLDLTRQNLWMAGADHFYRTQSYGLSSPTNTPRDFENTTFSEVLQGSDMPSGHNWDAIYYVTGHIAGGFAATTVWNTNGVMVGTNYAPVQMIQE